MKRAPQSGFIQAMCLFGSVALISLLFGCGGGGNSTTTPPPPPTIAINSVSSSSPSALTPLYVSTSGLDATKPFSLTLSNASGYSATLTPMRTQTDGTVVVAMPLYIDPTTGKTGSLNASLTLSQGSLTSVPVNLSIQDIPQLSDYGTNMGDISRAFYNYQAIVLGRMLNSLQAIQAMPGNKVDTTTAQANVSQQLRNVIKARNDLDRIIVNSTAGITAGTLPDGTPVNFDSNSLELMDRVIGIYLTTLQPSIAPAIRTKATRAHAGAPAVNLKYPGTTRRTIADAKAAKGAKAHVAPNSITMKNILDVIGGLSGAETVAGTVRTNLQSDPSLADRMISIVSGGAAVVGITSAIIGAPEVVAGAVIVGVACSTASILNDFYHIGSDISKIETLTASGTDPTELTQAQNDLKASAINLPLDILATVVAPLTIPAEGATLLGQEVVQVLENAGSGTTGATVQGANFLISTLQLVAQNSAINDQKAADSAAGQFQNPFPSPSEGFGDIAGTVSISNSQGPILSGLTGLSVIDTSGTGFSSIADQSGNYDVSVPLGDTTLSYSSMTVNAFDPITDLTLSSSVVDLTGLTSNTPFVGPTLSGTCNDTDAGSPDGDDPDCD
jgi:hypothetical protein